MVNKLLIISSLFLVQTFNATAQENETKASPQAKINPEKKDATHKPKIALGAGVFTYFGEVRDNSFSHLFTSSLGYELTVSRNISNSFGVDIRVIYGNLSVNERGAGNNYNFKSEVWNGSANLVYNFSGLYKKQRVIQPFISAGLAYLSFSSKTDLISATGLQYHYWNDGTIRDLDQGDINAENAVKLQRDYEYETDLREQNLDGLGKYKQFAISVPLAAGFNIKVSDRFGMKLSTTYFLNFTDLIDNISDVGEGARKGNSANDNFMFTSIGFSYALWSEEPFSSKSHKSKDVEKYKLPKDYYNDADLGDVSELDKTEPATPVKSNYVQPTDEEFESMKPYNRKSVNNAVMQAEGSAGEKGGNFTVQVGAYGRNVPQEIQKKIDEIPGVVQTKVNDSITIFTIGSYEKFEDAEKIQNQLIQNGLNDAFGLKENKVKEVTAKLDKLIKSNPELKKQYKSIMGVDVLTFKVQTEEYRGEFDVKKFADVISTYGMQMQTTTGGLKIYTFGSFDNYNDAQKLQSELTKRGISKLKVKSYLNEKPISVEDALEFFEKE
jgi:hypothetical protein